MANYYEMLGLPCEGKSVDDVKLIERTLLQWKNAKDDALNNETAEAKRKALREQLDEYPRMQALLKDAALRKQHATELRDKRIKQLTPIVRVMASCSGGSRSIARARVDRIANQIGLLPATVKKAFEGEGYQVIMTKPVNTGDFLLEDRILRKLESDFQLIYTYMQANPNDPMQALSKATNLYEYLAVMEGRSLGEAGEYQLRPTQELADKFGKKMTEHVKNAAPILYFKSIESQAKAQVFQNDQQREKYDNALRLRELDDLLSMLKQVPESIKLERTFAEECIRKIQSVFKDEDRAIAIYNKYGEMPTDALYEKESTQVVTLCVCQTVNTHDTLQQAEKALCSNCKKPLYRKCPKCGNMVPAVADFCGCGFFLKGTQSFELHYVRFQNALKDMDIDHAKDYLAHARISDPAEPRLKTMEQALGKLETELGKPIEEIKALIAAKKINAAQQKISALKAARPGVDLRQYQTQVTAELNWAAAEMEKCKRIANAGIGVETCSAILARVADYAPAHEWLRLHPPLPVQSVTAVVDAVHMTCALQWKDDPNNRFVTYTVVRKDGKTRPIGIQDGTQVAAGLKVSSFKDESLTAGKPYVYAVFAVRGEAASTPAVFGNLVCLFKPLDKVQANVTQSSCVLSWQDVPGSLGVRVRLQRAGSATAETLADCARGTFSHTGIRNGEQYRYLLGTVWELDGKRYVSADVVRDVRVEQKPPRVDLILSRVGADGNCEVTWRAAGGGTLRLIALAEGVSVVPDQIYGEAQIARMGKVIAPSVPVTAQKYAWYADKNQRMRVAAMRLYGDDFVGGGAVAISTVQPLQVDEDNTIIQNDVLNLRLKNVPEGATKIFYLVSTNGDTVTEQLAMRGSAPSVDGASCRRAGGITITDLPQRELTVSVMAMFGSSQTAYYSPVTTLKLSNAPKEIIRYRVKWGGKRFGKPNGTRKGAVLVVTPEGRRIPEMLLCARTDGRGIYGEFTPGMPGVIEVMSFGPEDAEPGVEYEYRLDEGLLSRVNKGAILSLQLVPKERDRYQPPMPIMVAVVPD